MSLGITRPPFRFLLQGLMVTESRRVRVSGACLDDPNAEAGLCLALCSKMGQSRWN